ncbi:MAG: aminomethyltransferase [Myxococcales bacterium]
MTARRTPLHDRHVQAGGRLIDFAGWELPVQYSGVLDEHATVRGAVGLFDVSHMGELRVTGPDAIAAVNRVVTNDVSKLVDGQAQYTAVCHPDGGIVDDMIVYRVGPTEVFICVNASNRDKDHAHYREFLSGDCVLEDQGDQWAQLALQGPLAGATLAGVFGEDLVAAMPPFHFRDLRFGGAMVRVATTGYTGEKGVELYVAPDHAGALWDALMAAGASHGIKPCGLGARDTLRLEMGYCLYGNDIDDTTTPLEAGLGWVTKLGKGDFVGRDALLRQKEAGVPRRLVGIELLDRGIPRHGYPIFAEGGAIGHVTSGTMSPTLKKPVAMGYVPTAFAAPGTPIEVEIRDRRVAARVVKFPFIQSF